MPRALLEMKEEEHKLLSEFVRSHLGLAFPLSKKGIFEMKLWRRLQDLQLRSYMEYYHYLLFSEEKREELEHLTEVLTNNETYFFRESEDIELFFEEFVPPLKRKRPRQVIRVLSLGCSTGEEPYTIAMAGIQSGNVPPPWKLEIHAVDINHRVIGEAVVGRYGKNSLRICSPQRLDKFFRANGNNRWILRDYVKSYVRFYHANLLELNESYFDGSFDAIFCRNVVIYFDSPTLLKAIRVMDGLLAKDGFLFTGHSESLISVTELFRPLRVSNQVVYVKHET
jgi:chemotaxis protein methyltransferase CheR